MMEEWEKERQTRETLALLRSDLFAADALVSLLWTAASSIRHDSLLRPFPPSLLPSSTSPASPFLALNDEHRDIARLRSLFRSLPSLDRVLESPSSLSPHSLSLLHWALSPKHFSLHYISTPQLKDALSPLPLPLSPDLVFQVDYSSEKEVRFQELATPHGTFHAFHGSQVECFYSILHNGLLSSFNRTSAFGEGTYLSTDLRVSINWSPSGPLWPSSSLPRVVSCVAVCEVIKHPTVISKQQSGGEPSLQQTVPQQYFVVTNDDMLRVSHILLFSRQSRRPSPPGWLRRHWFLVCVFLYLLFLGLLGTVQSRHWRRLWTRYWQT